LATVRSRHGRLPRRHGGPNAEHVIVEVDELGVAEWCTSPTRIAQP
jgi:hypothetical protein